MNQQPCPQKVKLNIEIEPELYEKLNYFNGKTKNNPLITEAISNFINKLYDDMRNTSTDKKVKELMAEKIEEIQQYNMNQNLYNIDNQTLNEIQQGNLKNNIVGAINTCPISDQYVISYSIQKDIPMKRYVEEKRIYETKNSYNIFIKTHKGEFVYSSAINGLKTLNKYNEYMNHH